ncbi:MAG TPA: diguanylate cyclase [Rhodomicrobium sp.]|nr:diguanylate cyclase [Rhodomicrobium sp.]
MAVQEFEARANGHALTLQKGIDQQLDDVFAVRAFFQTSKKLINRAEFMDFSKLLLHDHPAITGVSWIPRVKGAEREAHELAAREEGLTGYRINSALGDGTQDSPGGQSEYFPRLYSSNESAAASGIDLNDGGLRQRTLERARDGNVLATSATFQFRAGDGDRNGFFALLPVYAPNLPHESIEDRRRNLIGFVQGAFRTGVMIETVLGATSPGGLDLYFMSGDSDREGTLLYFHPSRARAGKTEPLSRAALFSGLHWTRELHIGDRKWLLVAAPIPGGPGVADYSAAWIALMVGLLFSGFIAAHFFNSGRHALRLQKANDALDAQNTRFDAALNNMSHGLVMFDSAEQLVVCNRLYVAMYGLLPEIVKPGCSLREVLKHGVEIGGVINDPEAFRLQFLASLAQGKIARSIIEMQDGREISVTSSLMPGGGWVAIHEDITERRRAEAQISYMAHHDALTGLPNRLLFRERLQQSLTRAKRDDHLAILCLDLDHFKSVNDTLGHPIGDMLLKLVADRLGKCIRETDLVARLGGDEFAIVQSSASQPTDATALATRLIGEVSGSYTLESHQVTIGISIGITMAPTDGLDPDQLLKNADLALYRAKADGRGVYRFFEPEMDALMQARRTLELDLRNGIANDEFQLYFQPLVRIDTGRVTGFEALIRWRHPLRGMISPAEFIPLAEETGLIVPLGEWVLHEACKEAATWPADVRVAVNLSPIQFRSKNLLPAVRSAFASRHGIQVNESAFSMVQ